MIGYTIHMQPDLQLDTLTGFPHPVQNGQTLVWNQFHSV